ncbi:MAG: hypothetical protein J7M08_09515, partial [Planctomycetes bacterium]|nr:hypothetical protein [Planctomycetota bacterium]
SPERRGPARMGDWSTPRTEASKFCLDTAHFMGGIFMSIFVVNAFFAVLSGEGERLDCVATFAAA